MGYTCKIWVTVIIMDHTLKNRSRVKKMVLVAQMTPIWKKKVKREKGHTWENGSHFEK